MACCSASGIEHIHINLLLLDPVERCLVKNTTPSWWTDYVLGVGDSGTRATDTDGVNLYWLTANYELPFVIVPLTCEGP